MSLSLRELLAIAGRYPAEKVRELIEALCATDRMALIEAWEGQALAKQLVPRRDDWRTWLIMAGRGFGKTRIGAEWVLEKARAFPKARIALIGASLDEVARVMIEGESGLLACARASEALTWRPTIGRLKFPSGALGLVYSGASPERLRGPQHQFAWADELAKWARGQATWDNLQMGLRLGAFQQVVVTTTPKPDETLTRIEADPATVVSRGATKDNVHLPASFVAAMEAAYAGTRLGRQELDGELLGEAEGALWTREMIEACRCPMPERAALARVVVAVDPPASASGDACGIVVCGTLSDGRGLVLADCSVAGERPQGWARRVVAAAKAWGADRVIAEANNGGEMVEDVMRAVAPGLPLRLVHASRGKGARAEPVALQFEARRCLFAGRFPELEDQLAGMTAQGFTGRGSPDRADAMVWALTELVVRARAEPRVVGL